MLDLLIDGEYQTEMAVDPQPAATLDQAKRMAQEWESELWRPRLVRPMVRGVMVRVVPTFTRARERAYE